MTDAKSRTMAVAQNVVEDYPEVPLQGPAGPQKTAKGLAREVIAEKDGVKPGTVRMREYREQHKRPTLRDIGMELDQDWLASVRKIQFEMDGIAKLLGTAKGRMTKLMADPEKLPGKFKQLQEDLEQIHRRFSWARPESLCPACKGLDGAMEKCAGCEALAWIQRGQVKDIPKELWNEPAEEPKEEEEGNPMAMIDEAPWLARTATKAEAPNE